MVLVLSIVKEVLPLKEGKKKGNVIEAVFGLTMDPARLESYKVNKGQSHSLEIDALTQVMQMLEDSPPFGSNETDI